MSHGPPQTIAHYVLNAKIGEGGMGEVYRARDTKLGRDVAIKMIPDSFAQNADRLARFHREAEVLASLNHPNIAAIYGVEARALVMELAEGPTLAERIAQGSITFDEALPIAKQIAEALEYAHEHNIIHRDLKPANVKIASQGRVKVLDFGLAKALASDSAASNPEASPTLTLQATMAGVIMGTAGYMAPEQAKGKEVDRRADIWSFGVVLMEMLTGRRLYTGDTVSETLASVMKDAPDFGTLPSDTPPAIKNLLHRCLEKDPLRRLQAIGEARIAIDQALAGGAPLEQSRTRRPLVPWGIAALATATALLLAYLDLRPSSAPARAIHFTVLAPEKTDYADTPTISPDGLHLAFTVWSNGHSALWVRSLDSAGARELPGTEGASEPFWSPDSRFIGFFADRKLKRIDLTGGAPLALCDTTSSVRGGAWNRDGVILFGSGVQALYRVSASGGTAVQATSLAPGEINQGSPYFLPDGRHYLYARMRQTADSGLYVGTLDPGSDTAKSAGLDKRLVATTTTGAVYAPPAKGRVGHLIYLRESSLMAQPFDPDRLELKGDPVVLTDIGATYSARPEFSVSGNGVLAYRNNIVAGSHFVWFDRTGADLGPVVAVDYLSHPAISPDGKRLLWTRPDPLGHWDLWLTDLTRQATSRLTIGDAMNDFASWSPDGQSVFYESTKSGTRRLMRKSVSGVGEEEVLFQSADWKSPGNALAGRVLLYSQLDPTTKWDIMILPLEGDRKPVPLVRTPYNEMHAQFSPDGKWFAYASAETGRYEVYIQSYPVSSAKLQVSITGGAQPRWRRDGKELYYLSLDGKLMAVEIKAGAAIEAGRPAALFQTRGPSAANLSFTYDVSADGRRFLVNTRDIGENNASPIHVVVNWTAGLK